MKTQIDIRFYIYMDKPGIDSIYNQLPLHNFHTTQTEYHSFNGNIDGKIESKIPFNLIGSASTTASIESQHQIKNECYIEISYEQKIEEILKTVCNDDIQLLPDILLQSSLSQHHLTACKGIFRLLQAFNESNNDYLSPFEIKNHPYSYKELSFNFCSYYNLISEQIDSIGDMTNPDGYYVDMFFSGSNMVRNVRHITKQIKYGTDFMFTVLGELSLYKNKIYCLKPFAIWRETDRQI